MAAAAEETGYDSVWVMDHFYQLPPMGGPSEPMLDSYTLLGALAARTSRVRLGTMVTGVTYRNPAHLAKIVTTLDVISAGRAILGIGAAWYDVEHEGLGFDFPPAGERLDRLEEALQICRAMFTEEAPTFDGPLLPDPRGPQRAAAGAAGRAADPHRGRRGEADPATRGAVRRHDEHLRRRRHGGPQGRRPARPLCGTRARPVRGDRQPAEHARASPASAEETAATRDFLRQVTGEEPTTSDIGTPDELVARVEELAAAGVEYFIFNMPTGTPDTVRQVGELLVDRFAD